MTDKYNYEKINESSKQFAIDNLKEDPTNINALIEQLRKWAIAMPHFNCPTDTDFLLRFLRVAKYDMKTAQKQLDSFCTMRSSHRGTPEYFDYVQIDGTTIDEFLDAQILTPLGRNNDGELIIFLAMKYWNPDKFPRSQFLALIFMGYDVILSEEETQIHGVRLFYDMTGVSAKALESWTDNKFLLELSRCYQDIFPWRLNYNVLYNMPPAFDEFFKIRSFHFNKKLGDKTFRTNDLEEAFKYMPGSKDLLPIEHGGCGGPFKQLTERWKKQFKDYYKDGFYLNDITVDESVRHEETLDYLDDYPDYEG